MSQYCHASSCALFLQSRSEKKRLGWSVICLNAVVTRRILWLAHLEFEFVDSGSIPGSCHYSTE